MILTIKLSIFWSVMADECNVRVGGLHRTNKFTNQNVKVRVIGLMDGPISIQCCTKLSCEKIKNEKLIE